MTSLRAIAGREAPQNEFYPAETLLGIEDRLTELVGAQPVRFGTPGWIARDAGEPA